MNRGFLIILVVALALLSACTPTIYGVPEENWNQMSEPERVAAMEAYRQHQIVLEQARAERARQRAIEEQARREREAEEARRRQERIDEIYRGGGVYGDLLQVTVRGGQIKFFGSHHPYQPLTFRIAQGEVKDLPVISDKGRKETLRVSYSDGSLVLDSRGAKPHQVARFTYDQAWGRGATFTDIHSKGDAELRGVEIAVTVLGEPPRRHHETKVVVVQQPPPRPQQPQVVVVQQPPPRPQQPQVVVVQQPPPRPQQPQVVVVQQPASPPPAVVAQPPQDRPRQVVTEAPPHQPGRHQSSNPGEVREEGGRPVASTAHAAPRPPQRVLVRLHKGTVKIKGKQQPFAPVEVRLDDGESRGIALQGKTGSLLVTISYQAGSLTVDDGSSPGNPGRGKARLDAERSWEKGRTYRLETPGSQSLKNVELEVVFDQAS